jgi:hypothetical protein
MKEQEPRLQTLHAMSLAALRQYLTQLPNGKVVLWCYLIWYLGVVARYFDPSPAIWLNSIGISAVIGLALNLSIGKRAPGASDRWQTFRLFFMPFAVSSFSSLIKGRGFVLILPPSAFETAGLAACCALFVLAVNIIRRVGGERRV